MDRIEHLNEQNVQQLAAWFMRWELARRKCWHMLPFIVTERQPFENTDQLQHLPCHNKFSDENQ